ncbi:hypothetical protein H6G93_13435 [Nostoc sp. FACHB-973]|uniref:Uncharacterized protein n=1 Tax=Desmonostoc muscorum LEGE 12446 TaxID=1828758 RepID=A0A8J7AFP3_DESMC|nr:hypothetical protein [Desmonostoc muscorum]MBD2516000.1 hypothetical protein [Nostoc sp. FACHB-973]MCF2151567.1 hypothetical protein [Desmonostoc muscorum LEGE 12446]
MDTYTVWSDCRICGVGDFQGKKYSIPAGRTRVRRVAQLCYPKNVQTIWDNLFSGSPLMKNSAAKMMPSEMPWN